MEDSSPDKCKVQHGGILQCRLEYDPHIPEVPIHHYVLEQIRKFPKDQIAMVEASGKKQWTVAEVLTAVKRLAAALQVNYNLAKGQVVALAMPNCPEFLVSVLAISECGGVASLINPAYTIGELDHVVETVRPDFWICTPQVLAQLLNRQEQERHGGDETTDDFIRAIVLDVGNDDHETQPAESYHNHWYSVLDSGCPESFIPPVIDVYQDLAIIPFSSGTTGMPKGVMLTHHNHVAWFCLYPKWRLVQEQNDVSLALLPFYHQFGWLSALGALTLGSKLIILPKFSFSEFLQTIQEHKVTTIVLVPPIATMLSKFPLVDEYNLSSIKSILIGAAPLGAEVIEKLKSKFGWRILFGYGMTETTLSIFITPDNENKTDSVGFLLPFNEVKIVSQDTGESLHAYEEGELCVRGPMVMKGYLRNTSATAGMIDAEGWLHTGDLAFYDQDEWFYIAGRLKELIKFKGYQVAPAELEHIILRHPDVTDAAVVGIPDEIAGELPRAYVVKRTDSTVTEEDVAKFLHRQVSAYKHLRGGVIFVPSIPKTGSGKILRRQLASLTAATDSTQAGVYQRGL